MDLPVVLPKFPASENVTIKGAWLEERDQLLEVSALIESVADHAARVEAEVMLKRVTVTSNELETYRKKLGAPFRAADKAIKAVADEARGPLEAEKERLKKLIADYVIKEEARRQEEFEARVNERELAMEEDPFAEIEEAPVVPLVPFKGSGLATVRRHWAFEIVDPEAVPRLYCSPDERKIRETVEALKEAAEIPGVRVFEETKVQSR
jgi:hypothetical protein